MILFKRRLKPDTGYGPWKSEYDLLAQYNSECAGGLIHTADYDERMRVLQRDYNENFLGHRVLP
jgi:hypothetical protein